MTDDLVRQLRQASMTNEDYRWKSADLIERLSGLNAQYLAALEEISDLAFYEVDSDKLLPRRIARAALNEEPRT